ncbi:MAG: nucleotidyltransferase family protein [Longimicrobiales bacterium]
MLITAVVLAAGGSSRLGSPKQLISYQGEKLITRAILNAVEAGVEQVVVVLGSNAEAIKRAVPDDPDVHVVINADWESGLASSLAAGLGRVDTRSDGVLVLVTDQPLVDAAALQDLVSRFDYGHRVIASSYGTTVGVPAVFGKEFFSELSSIEGDKGAGHWLRKNIVRVTLVALDTAELDIDTPDDVKRLEEH